MPRCTRSCLSCTLGLYTCNVIATGMSKRDLPGHFKEWKACLVEIGQTAHKLETNARANFPMAENLAYQCMENGGETCPH